MEYTHQNSSQTVAAQKTLDSLRQRRATPACFPCFRRKVKCRGGRPCEACIDRGHPEICHVEELTRGSRRHPKRKVQRSASIQPVATDISSGSEVKVGELSAISFVQRELGTPQGRSDTYHAMGMRSTGFPISISTLGSYGLDAQPPLKAEILQYYSSFRDLVMPLYPVIPDPVILETWMAEVLDTSRAQIAPAKLAVILSCLALGAQFTEAPLTGRWQISQALISRASNYLQRANCIFEPSRETIQGLLMVGIGLQNLGLSHGAWNLLGLTYRCAQSISLQNSIFDSEDGYTDALLWTAVTWQDALMSLRYDRAPLTTDEQGSDAIADTICRVYPYYGTLCKLCIAGRTLLRQPASLRYNSQKISANVRYLEQLVASAPDHLDPEYPGRTLQQKSEYYSFRVHSSLLLAEVCRPAFSVSEDEDVVITQTNRQKGIQYLFSVVESFLDMCTFSNVPLRSWSLTQAAVSCALVLGLLDVRKTCKKTQRLLQRTIESFRASGTSDASIANTSDAPVAEIDGIHVRSAAMLEAITSRRFEQDPMANQQLPPAASAQIYDNLNHGDDIEFFAHLTYEDFFNWPSDLSLFDNSFSDSLLQANPDRVPDEGFE